MREVSTYVYEERPDWFDDPFFLRDVDPTIVQALEAPEYQERIRNRPSSQAYKKALVVAQQNLKILADAGVRIAMGTDTGPAGRFQGYFEHSELQLMVDAGLTPMQTLVAATGEAARCLQIDNEVGTLEAGKWADFVVLSKNPLENIINTRTIETVWISGNLAHDFLVQNTSTQ
jgi:imidazolonepropionase-like amidohydrolase